MANVLVTGGAGYVGSACCRALLSNGHAVEIVDDLSTGFADAVPTGAVLHECAIADERSLSKVLAGNRIDVVFHFAAKASVPESVINPGPFFAANISDGVYLLEALRRHGIRNFVFSSSAAVYGTPQVVPTPEEHPKKPVNPYGESKLMFEQILQRYVSAYDWSVVAFRYFNACGGASSWGERHDPETHIIPLLLQVASGRRQFFEMFGTDYSTPDGTCLRDYVHVEDIAEAHLLALRKIDQTGFRSYNVGTGNGHSVKHLCNAVEKLTATKIPIKECARRPGDPPVLCASPKKLVDEFGWIPRHSSLDNILAGAWQWEQHQCKQLLSKV